MDQTLPLTAWHHLLADIALASSLSMKTPCYYSLSIGQGSWTTASLGLLNYFRSQIPSSFWVNVWQGTALMNYISLGGEWTNCQRQLSGYFVYGSSTSENKLPNSKLFFKTIFLANLEVFLFFFLIFLNIKCKSYICILYYGLGFYLFLSFIDTVLHQYNSTALTNEELFKNHLKKMQISN